MQNFQELNLSPEVAQAVTAMGFVKPTPIQAEALPILLKGATDFVGLAATGTGKTVAFGIPLIERLDRKKQAVQAVVLCPTRELAVQVTEQLKKIGQFKGIDARPIYGGTGYGDQIYAIRQGTPILVATPGRLVDHLRQGNLSLKTVRTIVLDEADEMLSMGFQEDLETILKSVGKAETWLFTATMSSGVRRVADQFLKAPQVAEINREEVLSGTVKQIVYTVRDKNKPRGICRVIAASDDFYGLIFCQTKALVMELTGYLTERGYRVDCLHGDKGQKERLATLNNFKNRRVNVLVASDVAARGLDVKALTHVINYSLPSDLEAYVHRIGRTARSGEAGLAVSLVAPEQMWMVNKIERITKSKIEMGLLPGRQEVTGKTLARLRSQFLATEGHEVFLQNLGTEWRPALEGKSPEEVVARFLSLLSPNLFDDREKNEPLNEEPPRAPQRRPGRRSTRFTRRSPAFAPHGGPGNWRRNRGRNRPESQR
ncbi:MAG: DEAD/DEAH box helicase [Deltaproteobacteria bacterium]|nr:DEAD/DEAH box helicase [Deltaproteobacteria bacterium]